MFHQDCKHKVDGTEDGEEVEGAGETEAIDPVDEPLDLDNTTYGTGATFANPELLEGHFEEHGDDFGAETSEEYEEQADTYLTGRMSDSTLEIERLNGDIVCFDTETDEFGVVHADRNIGTYFAPDPVQQFDSNFQRSSNRSRDFKVARLHSE